VTKAQRHMRRVAELGCAVCQHVGLGDSPAQVHHLFDRAARSDYLVAPLCPEHHQGKTGFHGAGQRAFERMYGLTEYDLLAWTIQRL
jgi:hypothetical protein